MKIAGDYSSIDTIVYYKMNENNGNRAYDLSINNISGFINVNDLGGGLSVWVAVADSFTKFIRSEFNGYERIEQLMSVSLLALPIFVLNGYRLIFKRRCASNGLWQKVHYGRSECIKQINNKLV